MSEAATAVAPTDPLGRRLGGWFGERFPVAMLIAGLPSFLAANLVGQAVVAPPTADDAAFVVTLGPAQLLGWLVAVGFLLSVRIFDEHKDFDDDVRLHPDRLLSRGVVTLGELHRLNLVVIVAMVAVSVWLGVAVVVTWSVAFAWLLLMRLEFFVGPWLRPRLVLYALTHAVVTPLATWWMLTTGAREFVWSATMVAYLVAAYGSSLLFELARKMLPVAEERPEVATYTSVLGTVGAGRAATSVTGVHLGGVAVALILLGDHVDATVRSVGLVAMATVAVLATQSFARFGADPTPATHRVVEPVAALTMLVPALVVIVGILVAADVTWSAS